MNTNETIPAAGTPYTMTELAPVTLGSSAFRVESQTMHATGNVMIHLHGSRGAVYFLREVWVRRNGKRVHEGEFQVISWKSGKELRQRGNEVRVTMIGDVIEERVGTVRG
jgi:hypothetical protein